MELPKPPMWYWMTASPPKVPLNGNLRSFGSTDFDEDFWIEDEHETVGSKCATLRRLNRELIQAFAKCLKDATAEDADESVLEPVNKKLTELHEAIGKLRIHEARASFIKAYHHEITERSEAVRRHRSRMASVLARIHEMLQDDDYVNYEKRDLQRYYDEVSLRDVMQDPRRFRHHFQRQFRGEEEEEQNDEP